MDPEGMGNRRGDETGIAHRRESDEPHPVREEIGGAGGGFHCQSGLAHPARSGEGDEAHALSPEQRDDFGCFPVPADEGVSGRGSEPARIGDAESSMAVHRPARGSVRLG